MRGESVGINRRRGHDDFEVGAARQDLFQITQQEIDVERTFVRFVNDDRVVGVQQRVGLGFGQQDAVGHKLHRRVAAEFVLKPHLVPDHFAQRRL